MQWWHWLMAVAASAVAILFGGLRVWEKYMEPWENESMSDFEEDDDW